MFEQWTQAEHKWKDSQLLVQIQNTKRGRKVGGRRWMTKSVLLERYKDAAVVEDIIKAKLRDPKLKATTVRDNPEPGLAGNPDWEQYLCWDEEFETEEEDTLLTKMCSFSQDSNGKGGKREKRKKRKQSTSSSSNKSTEETSVSDESSDKKRRSKKDRKKGGKKSKKADSKKPKQVEDRKKRKIEEKSEGDQSADEEEPGLKVPKPETREEKRKREKEEAAKKKEAEREEAKKKREDERAEKKQAEKEKRGLEQEEKKKKQAKRNEAKKALLHWIICTATGWTNFNRILLTTINNLKFHVVSVYFSLKHLRTLSPR